MPESIKNSSDSGSSANLDNREETTLSEEVVISSAFPSISESAPDPELLDDDSEVESEERRTGDADKELAKSDTPAWLRHTVGEVSPNLRILCGAAVLISLLILILSWMSGPEGSKEVLHGLLDILKSSLGGIFGGAIVHKYRKPASS